MLMKRRSASMLGSTPLNINTWVNPNSLNVQIIINKRQAEERHVPVVWTLWHYENCSLTESWMPGSVLNIYNMTLVKEGWLSGNYTSEKACLKGWIVPAACLNKMSTVIPAALGPKQRGWSQYLKSKLICSIHRYSFCVSLPDKSSLTYVWWWSMGEEKVMKSQFVCFEVLVCSNSNVLASKVFFWVGARLMGGAMNVIPVKGGGRIPELFCWGGKTHLRGGAWQSWGGLFGIFWLHL